MSEPNEAHLYGISLRGNEENSNGDSGVGTSFISSMNEESEIADLKTENMPTIQYNYRSSSPQQIDDDKVNGCESDCTSADFITYEGEDFQIKEEPYEGDKMDASFSIHIKHSSELDSRSLTLHSEVTNNSDTQDATTLLTSDHLESQLASDICNDKTNSSVVEVYIEDTDTLDTRTKSSDLHVEESQVLSTNTGQSELNTTTENDHTTTLNSDTLDDNCRQIDLVDTTAFMFYPTLEDGKKRLIAVKQTSQAIIKEISEGKIDVPQIINENYEAEYISNKVPSSTFKFIAPARGISGHYIDFGNLIATGVMGILCGLLVSTFSEVTCNFISIEKTIGNAGSTVYMHLGLIKFSSMDSIFTGNQFCVPYHNNYYYMKGPIFARHASELAILCGYCSVLTLWHYIFTKHTTEIWWKIGIYAAALASLFQLCTYQIFLSDICHDEKCYMGAGSFLSCVAVVSYGLVCYFMIKNSPVRYITTIDKHSLIDSSYKQSENHQDLV